MASTAELARAELRGARELGDMLGVHVPEGWPPDLYDDEAVRYWLELLDSDADSAGWCSYYFVLHEPDSLPVLIGAGGYKGKPRDGTVEIGYSIVARYQRRGFASEATAALVDNAFGHPRVERVIAETLPALQSSIGVLAKNGFRFVGEGSEPGVIRYELTRGEHAALLRAKIA